MSPPPLLLVHGYSDKGESFRTWRDLLRADGRDVRVVSYETLTNEITLHDIAEGFERLLKTEAGLKSDEPFDAMVHSTGMLVLRCWLVSHTSRRDRLKHLIGLAPATFGSPLAHKGRSWLGAIFKGRKVLGPDFLEAGNRVLDALELGSRVTWDLAEQDLLGREPCYGLTRSTPFAFVFVGNRGYKGIKGVISPDGSDGTVRWAGAALNTRKFVLDLSTRPGSRRTNRTRVAPWSNPDLPAYLVEGLDHTSILHGPNAQLIGLVRRALEVDSQASFEAWQAFARKETARNAEGITPYQQFVVRVVDERGDAVPDYFLELRSLDGRRRLDAFDEDPHPYSRDRSLRCFHVDLSKLGAAAGAEGFQLRIIASTGTSFVAYAGYQDRDVVAHSQPADAGDKWDASVELPAEFSIRGEKVTLFYPFTTTLIEIQLDREPTPLDGPPTLVRMDPA